MDLNLDSIASKHFHEVKIFCVEDLAGIFYRCLEHEEPRAEADWFSAERWINKKYSVFSFTEKYLTLSVYEELRKIDNELIQINSDFSGKISSDEVFKVKNYLSSKITKERFESIIDCLDSNKRQEYKKRFLGRDVWDKLYQPFRKVMQDAEIFNESKYGKVLFG